MFSAGDLACNPGMCPDWESKATFQFAGQHSVHWTTPVRAKRKKCYFHQQLYWLGYFECAGCLPCGITLIALSSCLYLISINFSWSAWPWSIIRRGISSAKLCRPLWISHTAPSPYTVQIFFLSFSCVFTFLEIIKYTIPIMLIYFLPSSILKWLHKNSPVLIFFKCTLTWQLSQYNLTKLF